ncbi:MAG TPA: GAF domain-containing sensor histidine kinase [Solirubrobacteraceae bacterium]|jgi:signal transduction histidine kinase
MPDSVLDHHRLLRLLDAGRHLMARLDLDGVLARLLDTARELTGAHYAAIGVLDDDRRTLERFLTSGIEPAAHEAIGDLPRGRGVLGVLIDDPRPLRLPDVGLHPRSFGFPAHHPPMTTFLGVPIVVRGQAWGNLYLTEKEGGEFDEADEEAVVVLAEWAAIAIENARLYEHAESQRARLEQAVEGLEATTAIAQAVGSETDLERVLELIVKRGRALVAARALVLLLREGEELTLAAVAGQVDAGALGSRMPVAGTVAGRVISSSRPERIADVAARLGIADEGFGVIGAETALLVPLHYRGRALGVLAAFDRLGDEPGFADREEGLLRAFAASAATAVATARSVEQERLRHSLRSAEQERRRWARELHDETLQGLAGLQVVLSSGLRQGGEALETTARAAVEQIQTEIANLRALITELRPAALDQLGLAPALESLVERMRAVEGIEVALECLPGDDGRLDPDLETAVYRLVQEALTNVAKHAAAEHARVRVRRTAGGAIELEVSDDGRGFDPRGPADGFGLVGIRERAALLGGTLEVTSTADGTTVVARLPAPPGTPLLRAS